jgi:hypothetical protein
MNVFLVVHLLDYLTAECFKEVVIGPYLDPLEDLDDIDTVWCSGLRTTSPCGHASAASG